MMSQPKWTALDALKFLCVAGMVLAHGFYWTWTQGGRFILPEGNTYFAIFQATMFLGFFPLTLPLIAGASVRLRFSEEAAPGPIHFPYLTLPLLLQCCLLVALGYAMNVLAAGSYALWAWNVLQLVAVSFLLIALLYRPHLVWPIALAGILVLAFSDPLKELFPPEGRNVLAKILLGDPSDFHSWPFFPWFGADVFGFLMAHAYIRTGGNAAFQRACFVIGICLAAIAGVSGSLLPVFDPQNLIGPRVMQPPVVFVLGLMGLAAILFAALTAVQDRLQFKRYGIVRCFSGGILAVYLAHIIIGVRLSRWIFSNVSQHAIVSNPWSGWHPLIVLGFPAFLLISSWFVGYLTVRWIQDKRINIRIRKVGADRSGAMANRGRP